MHRLLSLQPIPATWITLNTRTVRAKVFQVLETRSGNRSDNGPNDGVVRMLVCQILNFSQDPRAIGVLDELWTMDNVVDRARDWLRAQHHSDYLPLPTEPDELIRHPAFLRAHGAPTTIRLLPNDVLDIDCANFDAELGEGACLAVLHRLADGGDENTRSLRLSWEASHPGVSPLDALPSVGPRFGIPGLLVGGTMTCIENALGIEVLEFVGYEIPVIGPFLMVLSALSIVIGISASARA